MPRVSKSTQFYRQSINGSVPGKLMEKQLTQEEFRLASPAIVLPEKVETDCLRLF